NADGHIHGASIVLRDITERKQQEKERLQLIEELTEALKHVKTLNGLLPICASCKKIRNDGGYWEQVETYIRSRSNAEFTHGICPDCVRLLYPEYESILQDSTKSCSHHDRGASSSTPPIDYSMADRQRPLDGLDGRQE